MTAATRTRTSCSLRNALTVVAGILALLLTMPRAGSGTLRRASGEFACSSNDQRGRAFLEGQKRLVGLGPPVRLTVVWAGLDCGAVGVLDLQPGQYGKRLAAVGELKADSPAVYGADYSVGFIGQATNFGRGGLDPQFGFSHGHVIPRRVVSLP